MAPDSLRGQKTVNTKNCVGTPAPRSILIFAPSFSSRFRDIALIV